MLKKILTHNRADRVSALARVALALPTLGAVLYDPPQPQAYAPWVFGLLLAYAAMAALVALVVWRRPLSAPPIGQYVHVIDVAMFGALVFLTRGVISPLFPLYLFSVLSATLRWDWRGALGTSIAIILLFLAAAALPGTQLDVGEDDLLRFVVRLGQIIVIGALLAYIGVQRERYWRELMRLARPVEAQAATIPDAIRLCLAHVRSFFGVTSAIFIWESRDEPGWRIMRDGDGPPLPPLPGQGWAGPVAGGVAGSTFEYRADGRDCRRYDGDGTLHTVTGQLLDPQLAAAWGMAEGIATAISCDALDGWLLIPKAATVDDLYLARALSVQLGAALGNAAAADAWRDAAAREERVRVAHDLHDGILQFLTGLSLQLRLMDRQITTDPEAVAGRIATLSAALRQEQQDLRRVLEGIRPRASGPAEPGGPMADWLPGLARQWDISIAADIAAEPPPAVADDIRLITREAVANAVRHGGARHVSVHSAATADAWHLAIVDNGHGFAVPGQFTAESLRQRNMGPRSIMHRLAQLGGQLRLETGPQGTRLDMCFSTPAKAHP
ncbi:hypothetical protein CHU93_13565 [Sandarakinorhabdus cyanobacteriorum]|uniref:Signal transduction histidine kinase subgroup 3 dimerisation and phosphoacceptor domain-containing protein n=1 Tax=Sandarakinorhabdus cyanobacteriorum TaxID=1981098 RepID=A0A255YAT5_9SPHN|nr:histidine kinase [Sandarakinorhabdus cyanobacteriorum]OYQ25745.1 hypothetical protein CHU93_13565 [Sandarakinorhabdus cyanobacteriorum]